MLNKKSSYSQLEVILLEHTNGYVKLTEKLYLSFTLEAETLIKGIVNDNGKNRLPWMAVLGTNKPVSTQN